MMSADRLEYLRSQLRAECISYYELAELQSLAASIDPGDVELLEAAGVPEHAETASILDSTADLSGAPWAGGRTTREVAVELIEGARSYLLSPHTLDGTEAAELLRDAAHIIDPQVDA